MIDNQQIHPVILSGGTGTRLWPVSRELKPKQFQPVVSRQSLFSETLGRLGDARFAPPLVVCNDDHRFLVAEEFRAANSDPHAILLEPASRNTAPAIAAAAFFISQTLSDALMAVLPSDHVIGDIPAFYTAVDRAKGAALEGHLGTFGITPTRAETGYGYIKASAALVGHDAVHRIAKFVEKPDLETARSYIQAGGYFWNSGMFLFRASDFLHELQIHAPDVFDQCAQAVDEAESDAGFVKLGHAAFSRAPAISIDYAVMEKTDQSVVVPSQFGWSDVGSWSSLHELADRDENGNAAIGDVLLEGAKNSYVRSDGQLVAVVGIEDLVVVATDDAVLVAPLNRDQEVRAAVEILKQQDRQEVVAHRRVFRPWGSYKNLQVSENYLLKEIVVDPGAKLSLQYHNHRSEHWVIVQGRARVTNGDDLLELTLDQSIYIELGSRHRLENIGTEPLKVLEVQIGALLSEDDIVRIEDDFGRI